MSPPNTHIVVKLRDRSTPFLAEEVEYISSGWLRAVGCWQRTRWELGEDDRAYAVTERGETVDVTWPARRIAEVRHHG